MNDLKSAIKDLIIKGPKDLNIFCLVDATDECTDLSLRNIFQYLESLVTSSQNANVKICISARQMPEDSISKLNRYPGFLLGEKNSSDITAFVAQKAESFKNASLEGGFRQIGQTIVQKSDGMFLWADLVSQEMISDILQGSTVQELRTTLKEIPKDMNGLYGHLIDKIHGRYKEESFSMLSILASANSPLTLAQFRHVMAYGGHDKHPDPSSKDSCDDEMIRRRIHSRCTGLVNFRNKGSGFQKRIGLSEIKAQCVQFVHQTLEDFVLRRHSPVISHGLGPVSNTKGPYILLQACLAYLQSNEIRTLALQLSGTIRDDEKLKL